jgi:hypothetical protein
MINIIILSLEELRDLEKGKVVKCETKGVPTKIICTDSFQDAIALLEIDEKKEEE